MAHMILVRKTDLERLPEPIARYFHDWARSYKLLDIEMLRVDTKLSWSYDDYQCKRRGVGPSHDVECRSYDVGKTSFNEWVRKHPDLVVSIFVNDAWDHDGGCEDD